MDVAPQDGAQRGTLRACAAAIRRLAIVVAALFFVAGGFPGAAADFEKLVEGGSTDASGVARFLRDVEREGSSSCFRANAARWAFSTNATDPNRRRKLEQEQLHAKFQRLTRRRAQAFARSRLPDASARRQLALLMLDGRLALGDEEYNELQQLVADMKETYARAEVCPYSTRLALYCNLAMDPDIARALAASRDWDEQLHLWRAWRDAVGPQLRPKFIRHLHLANEAARINGYNNAGEQARAAYEVPGDGLPDILEETWSALQPLYKQLHTYVRRRLLQHYGPQRLRDDGPMPAHIFGNMWAQNWRHLAPLVMPYPRSHPIDVTGDMLRQGYTPLRMFQEAEAFFASLGLPAMPPEFWQHSMLERPLDREVSCAASAWDFCNHKDYRIKQCTAVTQDDLLALHHEMAHVQYYMAYADQPVVFRTGANPGFHEALGDAMALFAGNPRHLQRIGLLPNITDDQESQINYLMSIALEKVAYLPFAYIVDVWRWGIQSGRWRMDEMNSRWWELRLQHQGLVPPVPRSERDFDPGAKYHVAADMPYVRYFVSLVLQFQFLEALCLAAGHYGPLHHCDIYRSREAGRLLQEVLSAGASRPWQDAVRTLTRGRAAGLDPRPLLDFFRPLSDWLAQENSAERLVGWTANDADHALFASLHSSAEAHSASWILLLLATAYLCMPTITRFTLSLSAKIFN